jgi:hypothetical protein
MRAENWQFGRRPKQDDFEDLDPAGDGYSNYEENENNVDDNEEEVNLDNPDFEKGEMWSDYADDMDFEE